MSFLKKLKGVIKGPKAPKAPNYAAQAEQTALANQQAQTQADYANRPDQTDIYGNKTSWTNTAGVDPVTGKPVSKWSQQTTLSPGQQAMLDTQQATQKNLMGQVQNTLQNPMSYDGLQGYGQAPQGGQGIMGGLDLGSLGAMPTADDAGRQRIEQMLFDRQAPQHQQAQAQLEGKLANMGLTRGSQQWNNEMQRMGDQQSRERYDAMQTGGSEMQRLFGMQMQGRQQGYDELQGAGQFQNQAQNQGFNQGMQSAGFNNGLRQQQINERIQQRQQPINEMNSYTSGQQMNAPTFQGFNQSRSAGGADYTGAAGQQYGANQDQYNVKNTQRQGIMSGIGSLAGLFSKSDRRLKSNIVRVGTHPIGVGIYEYDIGGRRERGVMAQEMLQVQPERVKTHPSGFLTVNYEGL